MSLVPLPVILPLLGAGLALVAARWLWLQRLVTFAFLVATLATSVAVLIDVEANGIATHFVGSWPAPVGIVLVVDLMAAMFLTISMVVIVIVHVFAIGQGADTGSPRIANPVYLVLTAGVAMSFTTGDLFNLFVAFEVMLIASYVLLTLGARRAQIRSGMTYVVINMVASSLLLVAVGFVYAATGTVNMADLVGKFGELDDGLRIALGVMLLAVFSTKAALFPFFFWLPDSYPNAPTAITAVFAGLLTKVGIYTIIRTTTILELRELSGLLLFTAAVTMVIGVIGAMAQDDMKRILSFHIISQVGYMVVGVGLYTVAGLAATVLYVVHHIPVKTALFLVTGLVEHTAGSAQLHRLGGLIRRAPVVAALFVLPALSLAGIPPLSGFLAKLAIVEAGLSAEQWLVVAAALLAGLGTVFSMSKTWSGVFWGRPDDPTPELERSEDEPLRAPLLMTAATCAMVAVTFIVPIFAMAVYDLSERAALDLVDPTAYVTAVLG